MEYRGYRINSLSSLIGYEIEYIGQGSAHKSLRGMFTDLKTAKKFIDSYLERKEEKNVKADERSRSKQIQRRTNNRRKSSNNS